MPKAKINKTAIDSIPHTKEGQVILWDTELKGFGVIVNRFSKTFIVQRDVNGRSSRITLKNRPFIRRGKVISHETSAMGHGGPCFRINTPTIGGMSGGFAYVPMPYGSIIGACGIISSSKEIENSNHFLTEGDTLLVPSLGALALELPFQKTMTEKIRIFDLVRDGEIEDIRKSPDSFSIQKSSNNGITIKVS